MATLTEAQRAFVHESKYPGILTTLRADGSPHTTPVWVDTDGDDLLINTIESRQKARHMRGDPRVALIMVDPADAWHWVSVTGHVELDNESAMEVIHRLSRKYLGKDYPPEWIDPNDTRVTGRIRIEKVDSDGFDS
jgi:PPOX class probable F420-dependent enzyme